MKKQLWILVVLVICLISPLAFSCAEVNTGASEQNPDKVYSGTVIAIQDLHCNGWSSEVDSIVHFQGGERVLVDDGLSLEFGKAYTITVDKRDRIVSIELLNLE